MPRTPNHRHIADQAVSLPTKPPIPICILDEAVVRRVDDRQQTVTFRRVAETAGVSRSWLYRQPELREEINRLRDASAGRPGNLPVAERATTDSLRQQLRTYRDELTRLRTENQELREQLARHLGAARVAAVTKESKQS